MIFIMTVYFPEGVIWLLLVSALSSLLSVALSFSYTVFLQMTTVKLYHCSPCGSCDSFPTLETSTLSQ